RANGYAPDALCGDQHPRNPRYRRDAGNADCDADHALRGAERNAGHALWIGCAPWEHYQEPPEGHESAFRGALESDQKHEHHARRIANVRNIPAHLQFADVGYRNASAQNWEVSGEKS